MWLHILSGGKAGGGRTAGQSQATVLGRLPWTPERGHLREIESLSISQTAQVDKFITLQEGLSRKYTGARFCAQARC